MKDTWADGKEASKQLFQHFQQEPALQPSMDVALRQDAFSNKREPQPAFSQTPGLLHFITILCYALLILVCNVMPRHAMPCHAMPCHAMPCHAMPCYAMLCYAMSLTATYHTAMSVCEHINEYLLNELRNTGLCLRASCDVCSAATF